MTIMPAPQASARSGKIDMIHRPRRSVLYMPGSNARAIDKARSLPCDAVILDLEDSVAPDAKASARAQVVDALAQGGFGAREIVVRVNAADTPWGAEDLAAIAGAGADAILIPKVSHPDDLTAPQEVLGAGNPTRLWAMMETPRAMTGAAAITAAVRAKAPSLAVLVMGTNDLAKDTGARLLPGRALFLPWLAQCLAAARGEGLQIIDGVWNALDDAEGFVAECAQGRDLGMDGKTLIHPGQIEPCNRMFTPAAAELDWARKVVAAFELPENRSVGALRLEGRMVERLHAEIARRLLARAGEDAV